MKKNLSYLCTLVLVNFLSISVCPSHYPYRKRKKQRFKRKYPCKRSVHAASQTATNTFGIYTNSSNKINTVGVGLGVDYLLDKGFIVSGNIVYNNISNNDNTIQTDFNTPKMKFNISLANYTIQKVYGFNVTYRWQQSYEYQSSFISGTTPAFGTLDAQISRKLPGLFHSMIKIGATNLLNKYYVDAIGNASIGGLYYISLGINVF
jgi:hypothetical protein